MTDYTIANLLRDASLRPPMWDAIGIIGGEIDGQQLRLFVEPQAEHRLWGQRMHGGFYATVLDICTACVAQVPAAPDVMSLTVDLNVKMIRGAELGTRLIAEGEIIGGGKRLVHTQARLIDAQGTLYAWASATLSMKSMAT